MADEKKKRSALVDLINKIKKETNEQVPPAKPLLSNDEASDLATKPSTLDLGGGAMVKLLRKQIAEPETVKGTIEDAAKVAAQGLKKVLAEHPELSEANLQAHMVVMDGDIEQGTRYVVDIDGNYTKVDDGDKDNISGFPVKSAIEMMKVLDKKIKTNFGKDKHKDIDLPVDTNQAAIVSAVNKLHKQRHEQVDTLIELLAAVATYEAVAEQSPAEMKHSGDLRDFIECCNKTVVAVLKGNGCVCTLFHALEHIPVPGHSKVDMGKVN